MAGRRKHFGSQTGPTGRKRDEYMIFASDRHKESLVKVYGGTSGLEAYGQTGVKDAKRSVHHNHPHKWVKFHVTNESRLHRTVAKRRQGRS